MYCNTKTQLPALPMSRYTICIVTLSPAFSLSHNTLCVLRYTFPLAIKPLIHNTLNCIAIQSSILIAASVTMQSVYCNTLCPAASPFYVTIQSVYYDSNLASSAIQPFSITIQNLYRNTISFSPGPVFQPWCHNTMTVS